MAHVRRLRRSNNVPCRCVQEQFRMVISRMNRVNLAELCTEFNLGLSVVQEMLRHFRDVKLDNVESFSFYGERVWRNPVLCAACGAETTTTTDGLCRACWLGPIPINHWQALEHIRCDQSAPESTEVRATRSEMAAVDSEVRARLQAPEVVVTPERMSDLGDLISESCFLTPPESHTPVNRHRFAMVDDE